jgi:uncharacterized BrkB/YihY/UPF0761 family membrane protein
MPRKTQRGALLLIFIAFIWLILAGNFSHTEKTPWADLLHCPICQWQQQTLSLRVLCLVLLVVVFMLLFLMGEQRHLPHTTAKPQLLHSRSPPSCPAS